MSAISTFQEIINGFDFTELIRLLLRLIPSLLCITFHEMCHGLAAYCLGDDTAAKAGRLTLNPIKHIDIMGLLMMVLFRVGWAKPVPVNMERFRRPKLGMALTALAGPAGNLLCSALCFFIAGLAYRWLEASQAGLFVFRLLYATGELGIALAVFNLIPIPPLDGSRIAGLFLPDRAYYTLMKYERYIALALFLLVSLGTVSGALSQAINIVSKQFFEIMYLGYHISLRV